MTSAPRVVALVASSLEAMGVVGYLAIGALLLAFVVRWYREAVEPTSSSEGRPGPAAPAAGGTAAGPRADALRPPGASPR